jgi:hypothetical protein
LDDAHVGAAHGDERVEHIEQHLLAERDRRADGGLFGSAVAIAAAQTVRRTAASGVRRLLLPG